MNLKSKLNIIFIANAPLGSKKISIYQTLCQAQSLGNECNIDLFLPKRKDLKYSDLKIDSIIKEKLNISNNLTFKTKIVNYIDLTQYKFLNEFLRFSISQIFFSISAIKDALLKECGIIYTRDFYTMIILSILKKFRIIKLKIAFESHQFSLIRKFFSKNIDYLITINKFQKEIYDHPKSIVLHDCVWNNEIKKKQQQKKTEKNSIFFSGSCNQVKGIDRILALSEELHEYKFYIASLENYTDENIPKSFYRRNIKWLGNLDRKEIFKLLDKVEYCLLPNDPKSKDNLYTSPMKLFEYLSRGKIIIATPIETIKEILPNNYYFRLPEEIKEFQKFGTNFRLQSVKKIYKSNYSIIKKYTWENRAKELVKFIST